LIKGSGSELLKASCTSQRKCGTLSVSNTAVGTVEMRKNLWFDDTIKRIWLSIKINRRITILSYIKYVLSNIPQTRSHASQQGNFKLNH